VPTLSGLFLETDEHNRSLIVLSLVTNMARFVRAMLLF
jgi:hypothetical protein